MFFKNLWLKLTDSNELRAQKFLKISERFKSDLKKWIVMDYAVKPIGIVFESDKKEKCVSWVEQWNN